MRVLPPALLLFPLMVHAHVVSMSSSTLTIEGDRGRLELRMPLYEVQHMREPEKAIFASLAFSSSAGAATLEKSSCRIVSSDESYQCQATYKFPGTVEVLDVTSKLHEVTVPNHVHLLRAEKDGRTDNAVFDQSFNTAELRFVPPTPAEVAMSHSAAGLWRAIGGGPQLLFLLVVALAARKRREIWILLASVTGGVLAAALVTVAFEWRLPGPFLESAIALTIAYMAVEILILPKAGARWVVAAVLGAFHGCYYGLLLLSSGYSPLWFLAGAIVGSALILIALWGLLGLLRRAVQVRGRESRSDTSRSSLTIDRVLAVLLLATGLFWFVTRLRV